MIDNHVFAIFPYLKTSAPVAYRDIVVRSCEDFAGLGAEAVAHLKVLANRFYLDDVRRIPNITYTYCLCDAQGSAEHEFLTRIGELSTLLAYLYSSPSHDGSPFLTEEHAAYYVVRPERVSKYMVEHEGRTPQWPDGTPIQVGEFYEGYSGVVNGRMHTWFTSVSRVAPPTPGMFLNISQDIARDLAITRSQSRGLIVFDRIARASPDTDFRNRLLTALQWYNRSARTTNEEDLAIVSLAIAFECLLSLKGRERVTERFRDAVRLLLGPVPRLESWVGQFYDARSEVVHEGRSGRLMFVASDEAKPSAAVYTYRSLVTYGQMIFRICARTLVFGSSLADELELGSLFTTNRERLERLCAVLTKAEAPAASRLGEVEDLVLEIDKYRNVPEAGLSFEQLFGATKLLVKTYLELSPSEPEDVIAAMIDLAGAGRGDNLRFLEVLRMLSERLANRLPESGEADEKGRNAVVTFLKLVWSYSFLYYFALKRTSEEAGK